MFKFEKDVHYWHSHEFGYGRKMLKLDSHDHNLITNFYNFIPL